MKRLLLSVVLFLLFLGFSTNVLASSPDPEGITLSPVITELTLAPGKSQEIILKVINNETVDVSCEINYGELTQDESQPNNYEIDVVEYQTDSILTPKTGTFTVSAKQTYELPVTVRMPEKPDKSSYYPVILVGIKEADGKAFSTHREVASIVYLNLDASALINGKIYDIDANHFLKIELNVKRKLVAFPFNKFKVKIENTGKTYVKPFGNLTVLNPTNVKLKDIPVNQKLKILLPGQTLESEFRWDESEEKSLWYYLIPKFGKYTVAFGVDDKRNVTSISETFWVIPIYHIILLLLILFIVFVKIWNKKSKHRRKS